MNDWQRFKDYCRGSNMVYAEVKKTGQMRLVEAHRVYRNRHGLPAQTDSVYYIFEFGKQTYQTTSNRDAKAMFEFRTRNAEIKTE